MVIRSICRRATAFIAVTFAMQCVATDVRTPAPAAVRISQDTVLVTWEGTQPVDVFVADRPGLAVEKMRRISGDDRDGRHEYQLRSDRRPYFVVRWERDGEARHVAERVLAFENGSNFRDLGGYEGADGKHVRWGLIYRSGAMPKLTDRDYEYLGSLGIRVLCDLRSVEERELSPTRWQNIPSPPRYVAVDYPGSDIFAGLTTQVTSEGAGSPAATAASRRNLYRDWPESLAPQFKQIFTALIAGEAPLAFNCSAGQDRTGVATALVLTALGVSRQTILHDYHLSTTHRRPEFERSDVDLEKLAGTNIVARYYFEASKRGDGSSKPQPLYDDEGRARLLHAFDEIEQRWGSVERYLAEMVDVDPEDILRLRSLYLE